MNAPATTPPGFPRSAWVNAVRRGDTDLSYGDWVDEQRKQSDEQPNLHALNQRELNTIIAALRFWQAQPGHPARFANLATDGGTRALTSAEIDALAERINNDGELAQVIAYALHDPATGALVTLGRHKPGKAAHKRWNVQRLVGVK